MSDITPADALRELRDGDYPDYVAAAAKKADEDAERVDHAAEHYAMTGSDHCWCAEVTP